MKITVNDVSCIVCGQESIHEHLVCDTCGVVLSVHNGYFFYQLDTQFPLKLIFADERVYDFCNYNCLMQFLIAEWKKQLPKGDKDENNQ